MKYTAEQIAVIQKHVSVNRYNLRKAFKDASAELGNRTPQSISSKWYNDVRYSKGIFGLTPIKDNVKVKTGTKIEQVASLTKKLSTIKGKTASSKQKVAVLKSALKSLAKSL